MLMGSFFDATIHGCSTPISSSRGVLLVLFCVVKHRTSGYLFTFWTAWLLLKAISTKKAIFDDRCTARPSNITEGGGGDDSRSPKCGSRAYDAPGRPALMIASCLHYFNVVSSVCVDILWMLVSLTLGIKLEKQYILCSRSAAFFWSNPSISISRAASSSIIIVCWLHYYSSMRADQIIPSRSCIFPYAFDLTS